ncbi:MAG: hypothetical protein ACKVYV_16450 [Limisphaerales bacterium]
MIGSIEDRQFGCLEYVGPRKALLLNFFFRSLSAVKGWRTRTLEAYRFKEQAALFCYGMKMAMPTHDWAFAMWPEQQSDIDCVFRIKSEGSRRYLKVQLKEVVPESINQTASVQQILQKFNNSKASRGLVVGVYINRNGTLVVKDLILPEGFDGQVWLLGLCGENNQRRFLVGDLMNDPKTTLFEYPQFALGEQASDWKSDED